MKGHLDVNAELYALGALEPFERKSKNICAPVPLAPVGLLMRPRLWLS